MDRLTHYDAPSLVGSTSSSRLHTPRLGHSAPEALSALNAASLDHGFDSPIARRPLLPPWAYFATFQEARGEASSAVHVDLNAAEKDIIARVSFRLAQRIGNSDALQISREECVALLDEIQDALDKPNSSRRRDSIGPRRATVSLPMLDPIAFRRRASRLLAKLVSHCGQLPSSLFLEGVKLQNRDPLAGGGFADIFKGELDGVPVALKRLRIFATQSEETKVFQHFAQEVLMWRQLSHPHILPFLGVDTQTFSRGMCMVSPWLPYGNVHNFLTDRPRWRVEPFLRQAADGLTYLHALSIAHGDLRAANVLVDANCHVRLADFGLAIMVSETASLGTTPARGACRWMAPELQDPEQFELTSSQPNESSDVYSFACLCLELYTLDVPFAHVRHDATVVHRVLRGERPPRPTEQQTRGRTMPDRVWDVVQSCWNQAPRLRPASSNVVLHMAAVELDTPVSDN